jgi:hypothetical protein
MSRMLSLVLRYYLQAILAGRSDLSQRSPPAGPRAPENASREGAALLVSPGAYAGQSRGLSLATA